MTEDDDEEDDHAARMATSRPWEETELPRGREDVMRTDLTDIFRYHARLDDPPSRPWRLGGWIWATDGHFLVAFQQDDDTQETDPTPEGKQKARRYLEETPADLITVSLTALRAFVGATSSPPTACDECDGTGYQDASEVRCEHCGLFTRVKCDRCDGDGMGAVPMREGRIAGVPLDLELLAYALTFIAPPDVLVHLGSIMSLSTAPNRPHVALVIIGPAWRIVVMSILEPTHDVRTFVPSEARGLTPEPAAVSASPDHRDVPVRA